MGDRQPVVKQRHHRLSVILQNGESVAGGGPVGLAAAEASGGYIRKYLHTKSGVDVETRSLRLRRPWPPEPLPTPEPSGC